MQEKALTYEAEPELIEDHGELSLGRGTRIRALRYNPGALGRMNPPSGYGKVCGARGQTLEIYLRIRNQCIQDAMFFAGECVATRRCGSVVVQLSRGLDLDKAALIGGDTILALLNGLPKGKVHCAFLAAEALHEAIGDCMRKGAALGKGTGRLLNR